MHIAASTYLNSAPLVYSFTRGSLRDRYDFTGDVAPARCAALLSAGQCEIALIPVIEYQRIPGLRIIPEVAVAAKGRVRSVLLAARCPLDQVRHVTLDTSSRTSQALVKILFAQRYGARPQFTERTPDATADGANMLAASDAALVIGDPALRLAAAANQLDLQIYDLAAEWRSLTRLPFVFAVWALREDALARQSGLVGDFIAAKQEGVARLAQIAADYANELHLPPDDLLDYLRHNVNYDLDEENCAGMQRFFALADEEGLIPAAHALQFARRQAFNTSASNAG